MLVALIATVLLPKYDHLSLRGWRVNVDGTVFRSRQWEPTRQELDKQLYQITRVVPAAAVAKLRQITIWINANDPGTKCMAYHPGADYLREHAMNPEMAKGIEIGSPETFLKWTIDQPWMVFHELAHGYHDRFLPNGFANSEVMQAYGAAKAAGTYHTVMFWDGRLRDGYAETNQMEYFSELSEAYFGCNDMFPFVRGELMKVDPTGAKVTATAWGATSP